MAALQPVVGTAHRSETELLLEDSLAFSGPRDPKRSRPMADARWVRVFEKLQATVEI